MCFFRYNCHGKVKIPVIRENDALHIFNLMWALCASLFLCKRGGIVRPSAKIRVKLARTLLMPFASFR
jgi:hypothetical protein